MSLTLTWSGRDAADAVGRTRALCYAPMSSETATYQQRLANDTRVQPGDLLLAERDGAPVGTATSYSMTMWVRGRPVPCQGVAWVGTIKTHRRSGGIASAVIRAVLDKARERQQVLSALMPFRASFYDHFGYGLVERRTSWTIPLSILPGGPTDGFRFVNGSDEARRACRQRIVEAGQCDIERSPGSWEIAHLNEQEGYVVADHPSGGPMRSWWHWSQERQNGRDVLTVHDQAYDSIESLRRALAFFATLRDQYWAVTLLLPADLPLYYLLKETQVPHRPVNHDTAEARTFTRMQVRVLDHARLIEGMRVPATLRGAATVAIAETGGTTSTIRIEVEAGRATARRATGPADVECADRTWAAIVLGDLPASRAAELALIKVHTPAALPILDAFAAAGPAPFCNEYF
ncbi:MAG TPA: GNAT family N-acetyltransferase [Tepidisphaeraceae bacterium]|jgi:predicted acetyltransferase